MQHKPLLVRYFYKIIIIKKKKMCSNCKHAYKKRSEQMTFLLLHGTVLEHTQ